MRRLHSAIARAKDRLHEVRGRAEKHAGDEEAAIFDVQASMLDDADLLGEVESLIHQNIGAEKAFDLVMLEWRQHFAKHAHAMLRERVNAPLASSCGRLFDAALLAEATNDAAPDFSGEHWHGAMTYSNFTRPLWSWLAGDAAHVNFFGTPLPGPNRTGAEDFLAALAHMPQASGVAMGFDRVAMLALGATRIEQVLWTPVAEAR